MNVKASTIRAEAHVKLGSIIQRGVAKIIDRWSVRAAQEQPTAKRVHHETLLNHLPAFLEVLSRSLAESDDAETTKHGRQARQHGEQRWQTGWSLSEVVQDYQILRLVLFEYLDETLDRPLHTRETMAIGLALDEAISASVNAYVRENMEDAKKADEALRQQAQVLNESNRRKDEFLAVLGHELRNPLGTIRNAVQLLGLQSDDPATITWVRDLLERQSRHMTRLVDDLLDVSRVSRGKITLRLERIDVVQLVRDDAQAWRGSVNDAGLSLALDLPDQSVCVDADPTRLAQAVGNLVQNAVKFTEKGGAVTVRVVPDAASGRVAIKVQDTGVGLEPDLLARVFEMFMQADRSLERSRGGLGLGLALVRGLTELHGGGVAVASDGIGKGAEFTIWLPLAKDPLSPSDSRISGPLPRA